MTLSFTHKSNFDALAFAHSIQDILANEDFECKITELPDGECFELDLTIQLENKKLYIIDSFYSNSGPSSTRKSWLNKNDEQFSCAASFWRYVASNAKEI